MSEITIKVGINDTFCISDELISSISIKEIEKLLKIYSLIKPSGREYALYMLTGFAVGLNKENANKILSTVFDK